MNLLLIAVGGAIGATLRFLVSSNIYSPYGTLVVNVLGSFLIGFIYILVLEHNVGLRSFFMIGMLGAFTTFSTFSLETLNLLLANEHTKAFSNIFFSIILCLFATWLGIQLAKQLIKYA
jgi:CrcB protein